MLSFPAAERNSGPILEVFKERLSTQVNLVSIEIGSGSGQHVTLFAKNFPNITWNPTDISEENITSVKCYIEANNLTNVNAPKLLDASNPEWGYDENSIDIIYSANVIHISPFCVAEGIFAAAGKLLKKGGMLAFYGPFADGGVLEPESNVAFDRSLKERNSSWGIRDITNDLSKLAKNGNLELTFIHNMPANNKMLFYVKQ